MLKIEFCTRSSGAWIYPPPPTGVMTIERLKWLEYNIVLKLQITPIYGWKPPKIRIISKKASNESCLKLNFVQAVREHVRFSPVPAELWPSKDWNGWNIILYWNCKLHSFGAEHCQKYALFQMKAVQNWISYKKSETAYVSLPPPAVLQPSKEWAGRC